MSRIAIAFPRALVGLKALGVVKQAAEATVSTPTPIIDVLADRKKRATEQHEALIQLLQTVGTTIEQVKATVDQRFAEMTSYVVELAFGLASRVLRSEIDAGRYNPAPAVLDALHCAVESVSEGSIIVLLNPVDLEPCIDRLEDLKAPDLKRPEVRFEVDVSIEVGSCRIETSVGRILLDPETVLDTMMSKIREELAL